MQWLFLLTGQVEPKHSNKNKCSPQKNKVIVLPLICHPSVFLCVHSWGILQHKHKGLYWHPKHSSQQNNIVGAYFSLLLKDDLNIFENQKPFHMSTCITPIKWQNCLSWFKADYQIKQFSFINLLSMWLYLLNITRDCVLQRSKLSNYETPCVCLLCDQIYST